MKKLVCDVDADCDYVDDSMDQSDHGCGELAFALADGYAVGDRQLEGVMFRVYADPDADEYRVEVHEPDHPYVKGLNVKHWEKMMRQHVNETDFVECPICKMDVYLEENFS